MDSYGCPAYLKPIYIAITSNVDNSSVQYNTSSNQTEIRTGHRLGN